MVYKTSSMNKDGCKQTARIIRPVFAHTCISKMKLSSAVVGVMSTTLPQHLSLNNTKEGTGRGFSKNAIHGVDAALSPTACDSHLSLSCPNTDITTDSGSFEWLLPITNITFYKRDPWKLRTEEIRWERTERFYRSNEHRRMICFIFILHIHFTSYHHLVIMLTMWTVNAKELLCTRTAVDMRWYVWICCSYS